MRIVRQRLLRQRRKLYARLSHQWLELDLQREFLEAGDDEPAFLDVRYDEDHAARPEPSSTEAVKAFTRKLNAIEAKKAAITEKLKALWNVSIAAPPTKSKRAFSLPALNRDFYIAQRGNLSNKQICEGLDEQFFQIGKAPLGLPQSWTSRFGVKSYVAAYRHPKCKNLVQKLISVAKRKLGSYLG